MLKNYTSEVPVAKTVGRIEEILARSNVTNIHKEYENGQLVALSFKGILPNNVPVMVRLPANAKAVYTSLMKKVKRPNKGTHQRLTEQSARTAWKLMEDWVAVQISLIEMQQADFMQVFMPYIWDGQRSLYHRLKDGDFKALPEVCA